MARLFLDERNLRESGVSEQNIRTMRVLTAFVEEQQALEAAQAAIATQGDAIDAANTSITAANDAINSLDGRVDTLEAAGPYVEQDQAAAPAFTGQTITNPPTQAEVQAIDDALALLITRLQTVNVLT